MGKMNLFKVTMFLVILVISFRMRYRLTQIVLLKNFKLKIIKQQMLILTQILM